MKKKGDNCKEQRKKRGKSIHTRKTSLSQGKKQSFLRQNSSLEYLQFHSDLKKSKHFREKFGH